MRSIQQFCYFCEGLLFQLPALSHFTAHIALRQQQHLAFISEFNVQMLYLPGLKNVVAEFLLLPTTALIFQVENLILI
jgi:hypothetical protein